jgi:hypothetical protein
VGWTDTDDDRADDTIAVGVVALEIATDLRSELRTIRGCLEALLS